MKFKSLILAFTTLLCFGCQGASPNMASSPSAIRLPFSPSLTPLNSILIPKVAGFEVALGGTWDRLKSSLESQKYLITQYHPLETSSPSLVFYIDVNNPIKKIGTSPYSIIYSIVYVDNNHPAQLDFSLHRLVQPKNPLAYSQSEWDLIDPKVLIGKFGKPSNIQSKLFSTGVGDFASILLIWPNFRTVYTVTANVVVAQTPPVSTQEDIPLTFSICLLPTSISDVEMQSILMVRSNPSFMEQSDAFRYGKDLAKGQYQGISTTEEFAHALETGTCLKTEVDYNHN